MILQLIISDLFEFGQEKRCWHTAERFPTRNSPIQTKNNRVRMFTIFSNLNYQGFFSNP